MLVFLRRSSSLSRGRSPGWHSRRPCSTTSTSTYVVHSVSTSTLRSQSPECRDDLVDVTLGLTPTVGGELSRPESLDGSASTVVSHSNKSRIAAILLRELRQVLDPGVNILSDIIPLVNATAYSKP